MLGSNRDYRKDHLSSRFREYSQTVTKRPILTAFCIVFVPWFLLFLFGLVRLWCGCDQPLAMPGQFGDMFGMLGSLFAGFAIIAAAYTIRQQQKQIDEGSEDRAGQAFEQYLAARMNAMSSLAAIYQIKHEASGDAFRAFSERELSRMSRKFRQRLHLLMAEATLEFRPELRTEDIETYCQIRWLKDYLVEMHYRIAIHRYDPALEDPGVNVVDARIEVTNLLDIARNPSPVRDMVHKVLQAMQPYRTDQDHLIDPDQRSDIASSIRLLIAACDQLLAPSAVRAEPNFRKNSSATNPRRMTLSPSRSRIWASLGLSRICGSTSRISGGLVGARESG